jgi:NAD(P)-dependent dehydrogenase (short-subunit alcohol dehydrogenase family)
MPFSKLSSSDWESCWAVNVVGTFNVSSAFAASLSASADASIVNIASVSGRTGFQTSPPYSASKAAVINFTQVMARDLASQGVRVNAICPGMVFTPFYRAVRLAASEADNSLAGVSDEDYFQQKAQSLVPLGRGQEPEDIANVAVFLASPLAKNITGQTLNVDGGLVMS